MDEGSDEKKKGADVPFINNSEKEDNAIFSHQLKQFNHARSNTQDKSPLVEGQELLKP